MYLSVVSSNAATCIACHFSPCYVVNNKSSTEYYVAPVLCLHIKNSIKASVSFGKTHWVVHEIFSLFSVRAEAAILDSQFVKKVT